MLEDEREERALLREPAASSRAGTARPTRREGLEAPLIKEMSPWHQARSVAASRAKVGTAPLGTPGSSLRESHPLPASHVQSRLGAGVRDRRRKQGRRAQAPPRRLRSTLRPGGGAVSAGGNLRSRRRGALETVRAARLLVGSGGAEPAGVQRRRPGSPPASREAAIAGSSRRLRRCPAGSPGRRLRRAPPPELSSGALPDVVPLGMASRSLGVVVLFLWLQRPGSANENEIGILGSSVELGCRYAGEKSLDKLRVLWQANSKSCLVDAHFPNKREKARKYCEEFINRTQFNKENFSLKILNVTPGDEGTYECVVQRNKTMEFELDHKASTALKVAANYSKPTITRLGNEMTFTCNSSRGFPEPKLYWTTQMNNSLYNVTATSEPDGTFSISSTIKIKSASNIKLECTIENVRLRQSITTIFETNSSGDNSAFSASPANRPAILSTLALILILPVILYICWEKRLCPGRTYAAGVCVEEAVCANADVETENSLISGTEHQ